MWKKLISVSAYFGGSYFSSIKVVFGDFLGNDTKYQNHNEVSNGPHFEVQTCLRLDMTHLTLV